MTFKLPELPYAYDALAPYMSRETLEYHHDKHHKAYVDNGNKLLEGSGLEGKPLDYESGPVIWGEPGTNGQHAFYQLIHQGTSIIPTEFMIAANGHEKNLRHQHELLIANCLAQSEALMKGRTLEEAKA